MKTEDRGRKVDEWKMRPEQSDNHWLDCVVGDAVAAAIPGSVLFGTGQENRRSGDRVKLSTLQRSKW